MALVPRKIRKPKERADKHNPLEQPEKWHEELAERGIKTEIITPKGKKQAPYVLYRN